MCFAQISTPDVPQTFADKTRAAFVDSFSAAMSRWRNGIIAPVYKRFWRFPHSGVLGIISSIYRIMRLTKTPDLKLLRAAVYKTSSAGLLVAEAFIYAHRFVNLILRPLNVNLAMNHPVFSNGHDGKIFDPIVQFDTIYVVNMLVGLQGPAKMLFHDITMLTSTLSVNPNDFI